MHSLDLDAVRAAPVTASPFAFIVVPGFVRGDAVAAVAADFPRIAKPGSFPPEELEFGPAFARLLDELRGPEVTACLGEKFAVDLSGRPTLVTVRGRAAPRDGRIHTDSESKVVTALIYLNPAWEAPGGRLRLLRSAQDLDDYIVEVPPDAGTLLAFRRSANSFHGHRPFSGERRSIQVNWMTDAGVARREQARHRLSARLKRLNPFA
ncbi:MAG: 2OG-Fe(II) oxygenase [Dongiaceae bacterium]